MKYEAKRRSYEVCENFEIPLTLYYNRDYKKYLQKFLKLKLVGITNDFEEVSLGGVKLDLAQLADKGARKLIS